MTTSNFRVIARSLTTKQSPQAAESRDRHTSLRCVRDDKYLLLPILFTASWLLALPARAQQLALPDCVKSGNCQLEQIVQTGAAFANLLTEISGAVFFATFVYGGFMYLISFGDKSRVDKGKKAMVGGAIGMAIVLLAWTIVRFVATSLGVGST